MQAKDWTEPSAAELAAIEHEMPLIEAELDLLDAEIIVLCAERALSELDWQRVRSAQRRALRAAASLYDRPAAFASLLRIAA
ncbi:DUF6284 family protein [Plantactinospora solaniradicis]|uniref:DUF6284 family protein n=1 Tax=Plantactinospora solaniradicis TaxID=1723736 RepID=A0ABW1K2S6_9ACTN